MILSMTGFGRAEGVVKERRVTVEIRSLNSKQLDLLVRLPSGLKEKEAELRQFISERIIRGKVEMYVNVDGQQGIKRTRFDRDLVKLYHQDLSSLVKEMDPSSDIDVLQFVLRMPDVLVNTPEAPDEEEWEGVKTLVDQATAHFESFRRSEGDRLGDDLRARVNKIEDLLKQVEALDGGRTDRTRERIRGKLSESQVNVDQDRFEQELIYYLEKLDITEEKVRLRSHCHYFVETLNGDPQQGRKLSFIGQEMGREINTLGSKANDAPIQRLVVMMKDELEKVKEQVLNVL
jgi:uncharacterized protein (TIGR00255 family)